MDQEKCILKDKKLKLIKSILLPSFPDSWMKPRDQWTDFRLCLGDSPERLIGLTNANRTDKRVK